MGTIGSNPNEKASDRNASAAPEPAAAPQPDAPRDAEAETEAATVPTTAIPTDAPAADASASAAEPDPSAAPEPPASAKRKRLKRLAIALIVALVALLVIGAAVMFVAKSFTDQEKAVRSDWSVETGDLLANNEELGVSLFDAGIDSMLRVVRIVPTGSNAVGFTYHDTEVQDRLAQAVTGLQQCGINWTASNPLAILNPFGTGANGLYLYFTTDRSTQVTYTVSAEGTADFTRTARDIGIDQEIRLDENGCTNVHSFQIIGLVPGKENHVTLTVTGPRGGVTQKVEFTVDMPETDSGYPTQLESADGESTAELSDGLYALMRTNGYLGYGFFFDNDGTMRYEMVTEGFGLDRMLMDEDDAIVCTSTQAISRIDGLGRVKAAYRLDGYDLHHDINYGPDGTVLALAEVQGRETVEDVVLEVDLETGEVTELIDFSALMADYKDAFTHPIGATDTFFWQAGEWDWIHLNSIQYLEEDDAIIVSSRETSTIMKVADTHGAPQVEWFAGDDGVWAGTPYEGLTLEQAGDFTPQYGQHSVEYDGEGPTEGSYYLLMFDNNYWASSTRDDFAPNLEGTDVGTDLYSGTASYVYRYLIDEQAGTFELVDSFAVPYSSIVSNVSHAPDATNYVVNSGVANIYGEYDESGELIRQFFYICQLQGYRAFKDSFAGFWFAS